MRLLKSVLLLALTVLVLHGCATGPVGFPHAKSDPKATSTTTPSECLARGKTAEEAGNWGTAYRWYARGGGWNVKGRSTGFPPPGELSEPEESQRFLCIAAFLEATRHLIAEGVRVDVDGVHPLYISISEADRAISYFRNANPHGYAGLTAAQLTALQRGADAASAQAVAARHDVTMDTVEQVDRRPSNLQVFQDTVASSSTRPSEEKRPAIASQPPGSSPRDALNLQQLPPVTLPAEKRTSHAEAARIYREAAARYPADDARRQEMLKLATEEEREAAAENGNAKSDARPPK